MEKIELDEKLIEQKRIELSELINGMRVPEVWAVLGQIVISLTAELQERDESFGQYVQDWLQNLEKQVDGFLKEMREETDKAKIRLN
jgi:hypothetical protein